MWPEWSWRGKKKKKERKRTPVQIVALDGLVQALKLSEGLCSGAMFKFSSHCGGGLGGV